MKAVKLGCSRKIKDHNHIFHFFPFSILSVAYYVTTKVHVIWLINTQTLKNIDYNKANIFFVIFYQEQTIPLIV